MPGRRRRSTSKTAGTTRATSRSTAAASRRRAPAKPSRAAKPAAELPTAGPGGAGVGAGRPVPRARARARSGTQGCRRTSGSAPELPAELAPYDPPPYTFERFLEDELNEKPRPLPMARPMTPRDQQWDGADVVAAHAAAGGRVFLLGDDPGVGKTGTAILAARLIAEQRDVRTVLVVADRPAAITIPHWARSIAGFGDGGLRWCVTTWDRLAKVSKLRFDVVIADEAHMVRHTTTQRWKHWKAVSGAGAGQGRAVRARRDRHPGAHAAGAALPGAAVRRPARASRCASGPTSRSGWPRSGSTWNEAATAGSGPRTPTSAAPTSPGCRAGWPTPIRRPRCTDRRRGVRCR